MPFPRLYAIIDLAHTGDRAPVEVATTLLEAGVALIQYRSKHRSSREMYEDCLAIHERVRRAGGVFIVNDRADVALAVNADGVHLGQDDLPVELARGVLGPGKWVGYSTHNLAQVCEADELSADYIAFGPIFPTGSKENPEPVVGLAGLAEARKVTRKPLVAIGGVTLENARAVMEAGADSVAVIGGLLKAPDLTSRAREFFAVLAEQRTVGRSQARSL
ncbi:MAG: thiamine phosphate synthase [Terriglobia bacterium]